MSSSEPTTQKCQDIALTDSAPADSSRLKDLYAGEQPAASDATQDAKICHGLQHTTIKPPCAKAWMSAKHGCLQLSYACLPQALKLDGLSNRVPYHSRTKLHYDSLLCMANDIMSRTDLCYNQRKHAYCFTMIYAIP